MPEPLLPNTMVTSRAFYQVNGQTCINTLTYYTGSVGVPDYTTALAAMNVYMRSSIGPWGKLLNSLASNCDYAETQAQPFWPYRLRPVVTTSPSSGGFGGDCNAPNLQVCIDKSSPNARRWGQGSLHIGGISTDQAGGGVWSDVILAAVGLIGTAALLTFTAGGVTFVPVLFNELHPERISYWDRFTVKRTVRTMRRRTVGLGI